MMTLRTLLLATIVLAAPLGLSACGKMSSPEYPPGSDYPRQYPSAEEKQKATDPQQETGSGNETGNENKGGAQSPLGFPLEYPNRSSY